MLLQLILKTIPFEAIAEGLIEAAMPNGPLWLGPLMGAIAQLIKETVEELTDPDYATMTGAEKLRAVVETVKNELDEGFDDIPEWNELDEPKRDRIIEGLAELTLFVHKIATEPKGARVSTTKVLRRMRRKLKRDEVSIEKKA